MELSLHRLKLLRELSRRGTVTAAAQSLNYTVSAVSQQLALLERDAGTRLFEKRGRRMVLTEAGLVLAEHAEEILATVDRATIAMETARSGVSARLTAGVWASVAAGLLPAALGILERDHSGIEVRTKELAPEETAGAVRDGALDFSFVIDYSNYPMAWDPSLSRAVIARERMYAALAPGTAESDSIQLSELSRQPWILAGPRSHFGKAVRQACQQAGFDPVIRHEVGEQATALAMVASGLGVTLVSDLGLSLVPERIDIVPLEDPFFRTVSVAHRASSTPRASVQLVIDALREAAESLGLGDDLATGA
ncbi:LysR family transcriptional regulator [Rhodococcus triatomae]|uniref:DNA-binding transcriptional regulator, LysR family n=1 Tax=Rhodococcus triatomae TaxID=300028 RepID=A0A1G8IEK0_9NOCA|nr:LysR family transcriptional regulator [Rhodococcus triatomae]QNG21030.1 LysR family transcriptional regulator [Rhodococcus triatomae]QNG23055.1 LysR family transcriptional regulator [Rhodococcus triatomae]SDI17151.1 DNA-binding transcriptional regulator, LysR family [Rhodococcus triatomae]